MFRKTAFVLWGALLAQAPAWGQCFRGPTNYATLREPRSVTIGDFNVDGKPDLAVANAASDYVSVLLGNGDGTFGAALNTGTFVEPVALAVGDFNADGKPDLAVANSVSGSVLVLIGNGDGTFIFSAQNNYDTGDSPNSVAVGDFNGDGKPDLTVVNSSGLGSSLSVLLGNGNGTFQAATTVAAISGLPDVVAVGDVNKDGKADLAVSVLLNNNVLLFLGNGNGTFGSPGTLAVGNVPRGLTVSDLNADGNPDLAVANSSGLSNSVSVLLGNGNGTFQTKVDYAAGAQPRSVAVGDLNGDGKLDLAVPNNNANTVSVLPGNGDGTFQSKTDYAVGSEPQSAVVGDFNADGKGDLAVGNNGSNTVSVLLGAAPAYGVLVSGAPVCAGQSLTLAVSVTCSDSGTLTAQLSDGSGSFANPVSLGAVTVGSQSVTIPQNAPTGTGYRIRVVSSNPSATSEPGDAFTVNAPGVTKPTVGGAPVCVGQTVTVQFSALCVGTLTAQLSDQNGSFASPVGLGSVVAGQANTVTIPGGTAAGTGYRIRVVSSNPSATGEPGDPFTVQVPGVAKPTLRGVPVCNGQAVGLQFSALCVGTLTAQLSDQNGSFANPVSLGTVEAGSPSVTIPVNTPAGTGYRIRVVSTNPAVVGEASEAFTVNTLAFTAAPVVTGAPLCAGQALTLTFAASCTAGASFQAQLSDKDGSFAAPVNLGTVTAGSNPVVIPSSTPSGTGYRLRVVSTAPALTSQASTAFTVNALGPLAMAPPTTPGRVCQGGALAVTLTTTGSCPFPLGNVFTVQLSSATGNFASPTVLGVAGVGTGSFSLPEGLPVGSGYRVRVVSSRPALISPGSVPFRVEGPSLSGVTPTVSGAPVCRGQAVMVAFSLPEGSCAFPEGNVFTAQLSSAFGTFNNPTSLGVVMPGSNPAVVIPSGVGAGTGYRIRVVSSTPALTSGVSGAFRVNACTSRLSAEEPALVVAPNPVQGREIRVRVSGMDNPAFSLTTSTGRTVPVGVKAGTEEIVLVPRQALAPGVYVVQAREGTLRLSQRVLVVE